MRIPRLRLLVAALSALSALMVGTTAGPATAAAPPTGNNYTWNNTANHSWQEGFRLNCGQYQAIFQGDGNFVVYRGSHATWNSHTAGLPRGYEYLYFTRDGQISIWVYPGYLPWSNQVHTSAYRYYKLTMQCDGNLVEYGSNSSNFVSPHVLWATYTS